MSTNPLPGATGSDTRAVLDHFFAAEAAYIAATGEGGADFGDLAECLARDVALYQADSLPYGGVWRGHEGIEAFIQAMSRTWQSLEFFEQHFITAGDTVAVHNRGRLRARSTGRALDTEVVQLMTVEAGRITVIRPFYLDTAAVLETLAAGGELPSNGSGERRPSHSGH